MIADEMNIWNFKIEAVALTVAASLLNLKSHNGYSLWATAPRVKCTVQWECVSFRLQAIYCVNHPDSIDGARC